MTRRSWTDPATVAGLLVVWSVAWSAPLGRLTWDTKYDLLVDPWGFLGRASQLWDPQVTWGGLANQGYGYLFPMGPFFALATEVVPPWVAQRLWWSLLLTLGFVGALGLLHALGVGAGRGRVVGALAWALAPKVVSSVSTLSAEIQPQILAPLVLWPIVLGCRGRLSPWRASLLSGAAVLLCGGVNGSATLLALVPTGLFLVTRPRWWQSRLTWLWAITVLAATAWWLGPLLLMSRYAPPFLDWIETASAVSAPIGLLDVLRGTTHWLGHLLTPGGPWWAAGYQLATTPWLIVLTSAVAAAGLMGLSLRTMPYRGFCWLALAIGVTALSLPHMGPLGSPAVDGAQAALDGVLAPFRNIHKVDALVRLPLMLGLTHLLGVLSGGSTVRSTGTADRGRRSAVLVSACLVVASAAPAFTGAAVSRGGHEAVPGHWVEAGEWLDREAGTDGTLVVPASSFGEYTWGRTIDEPLRALTSAPVAVRDAVPLAPAGAIRLLDEVERRLHTGRSIGGATDALRRAGVGYLLVRNDLDSTRSGQPPTDLARSAVRASAGVEFVRGFGHPVDSVVGDRVHPVEIYRLDGAVAPPASLWERSDVLLASGATDDLPRLADGGLGGRPVIFDEDVRADLMPQGSVLTDGLRSRNRFFGAERGNDVTATLTAREADDARDYLPWAGRTPRSTMTYEGIRDVTASSSLAQDLTFAGLQPAMRPFAAVDSDPTTGWLTMWDPAPTLTVALDAARTIDHLDITPFTDATLAPWGLEAATAVTVTTDSGTIAATLGSGRTRVDLPEGPTSTVTLTIDETRRRDPSTVVTGIAEIAIAGLAAREVLAIPNRHGPLATGIILGAGRAGRDGCAVTFDGLRCLGQQTVVAESSAGAGYLLPPVAQGAWTLGGTLMANPGAVSPFRSPDVRVVASSSRSPAPAAQVGAVVDGDPRTAWSPDLGDRAPILTFTFPTDVTVERIELGIRGTWAARASQAVRIEIGGQEHTRRLPPSGVLTLPPTTGEVLRLQFLPLPGSGAAGVAGMELEEVELPGVSIGPPPDTLDAPCGQGPPVTVNGERVPTSVQAERDGWLGLVPVRWEACAEVSLSGAGDRVDIGDWRGLAPADTVMRHPGADLETTPVAGAPAALSDLAAGLPLRGAIGAAETTRLLALTQNANDGWQATLGGQSLAPQVVDGTRQGFIVPAGASGDLEISFGPDRAYRVLLIVGLCLAVLVLAGAAVAAVRGSRDDDAAGQRGSRDHDAAAPPFDAGPGVFRQWAVRGLAITVGALVAGPVGALVSALGVLVAPRLADRQRLAAVATLVLGSAVVQAVVSPTSLGPAWLEGGVRVALIAALALAFSTGQPRCQTRRRQLDEAVADKPEEHAHR